MKALNGKITVKILLEYLQEIIETDPLNAGLQIVFLDVINDAHIGYVEDEKVMILSSLCTRDHV